MTIPPAIAPRTATTLGETTAPGQTWAGTHRFRATFLLQPRSTDEVVDIVKTSRRVRALGTRHSFNDIADTEGDLLTLVGLPADPVLDPERSTVTVGAGTRFGDLARYLDERGYALHNMGSLPHISIAGACATGTHGSGNSNGSLSSAVAGMEMVSGGGHVLRVQRGDPGFDGMVVSLGALGIVTRIELDVQPRYDMRQDVYLGLPWARLLDDVDAVFASGYSVSVFTDWIGETLGETCVKTRIDDDGSFSRLGVYSELETAPPTRPGGENRTIQGGIAGPWHERLPHFRIESVPSYGDEIQSEYFVDRDHGSAALSALRQLGDRIVPHLLGSEIRSVARDSLWLSPAHERDSLAIHFTWRNDPAAVAALLPAIEEALRPYDPRPHWGKWFAMSAHEIEAKYSRSSDFARLAHQMDPQRQFRNAYLERVLSLPGGPAPERP